MIPWEMRVPIRFLHTRMKTGLAEKYICQSVDLRTEEVIMSRGYDRDRPARLYVGNLPDDVREREIEDLFSKVRKVFASKKKNSLNTTGEYGCFSFHITTAFIFSIFSSLMIEA